MSASLRPIDWSETQEKRSGPRSALGLPVLLAWEGARHNSLLCNLSRAGAKIETPLPLIVGDRLELHCGSICIDSKVLWRRGNAFGIEFACPIGQEQLAEQLSRAEAIANWRKGRTSVIAGINPEKSPPLTNDDPM